MSRPYLTRDVTDSHRLGYVLGVLASAAEAIADGGDYQARAMDRLTELAREAKVYLDGEAR
jgi:fatty acid-binding protein DegV